MFVKRVRHAFGDYTTLSATPNFILENDRTRAISVAEGSHVETRLRDTIKVQVAVRDVGQVSAAMMSLEMVEKAWMVLNIKTTMTALMNTVDASVSRTENGNSSKLRRIPTGQCTDSTRAHIHPHHVNYSSSKEAAWVHHRLFTQAQVVSHRLVT